MRLLIDECLHTSLLEIARAAGHLADHVNYLGLGGLKDWELMATIRECEYTFVTNNRSDFLSLHEQEPLHPGVVIIIPNVTPARQRDLFAAVLEHIGPRDLTNTVVEVNYAGGRIDCVEYELPRQRNEQRKARAASQQHTATLNATRSEPACTRRDGLARMARIARASVAEASSD